MEKIKTHLVARLCWLAFGLIMGVTRISDGLQSASAATSLTGVGWLLLGVLWFLSPLVLGKSKGEMAGRQRQAAIGSDALRNSLLFAAVACVGVGLVLRFTAAG